MTSITNEEELARVFHSLIVPISQHSGKVIPVTMPHCTPHAITTSSLAVPISTCLPLTPPDASEVKTSFFATGEFDENSFIRRCAFLSSVDVDEAEEPQVEETQVPAATVAAATAGSQITATPKLPGNHDDDHLTVSDVAVDAEAHNARRRGFFGCFACGAN